MIQDVLKFLAGLVLSLLSMLAVLAIVVIFMGVFVFAVLWVVIQLMNFFDVTIPITTVLIGHV